MVIKGKCFSHHCARSQAATLTWLVYYDFTCVYITKNADFAEIAICVRPQRCENAFSQSHQHDDRNTDISGKLTEIYGAASGHEIFITHMEYRAGGAINKTGWRARV